MSRLRPRYDGAFVATVGGIWDRVRDRGRTLDLDDEDRLDGKTCLVTGANRGLGLAVATELARRGARVVLACRSGIPEVIDVVKREAGGGDVEAIHLDLSDLASVEKAVDRLDGAQLAVTILNAGIVPREARPTRDGFDESFQVNFLANVLLVRRLMERGHISSPEPRTFAPRLVSVSSESHRSAPPIDFSKLGVYRGWGMREAVEQYGAGKLLLQTFTEELTRRARGQFAVHSLCPGAVHTDIGREAPRWVRPALDLTMRAFFKAPAEAAMPVVHLAAARSLEGHTGVYLHVKRQRDASEEARRAENGKRIWEEAERLLKSAGHSLSPLPEGAPR